MRRSALHTEAAARRDRGRSGFSLIEVIVALTVMIILAATITPNILGLLDRERIERTDAILADFVEGIVDMKSATSHYPSELLHLTEPIATNERNSCGAFYPGGATSNWLDSGPFIARLVDPAGVISPIGTIVNLLDRVPDNTGGGGGSSGVLRIDVTGVTLTDAQALNDLVDGDASASLGTIRWTDLGTGYVVLHYTMAISGC